MVCTICRQPGHNRRTCPQRVRQTNENPPPQTPDQRANQGADPGHPLVRQRGERRREDRRREDRRRRPVAGDRPNPRRLFEVPTIPDLKRYYLDHEALPPYHQYVSQDIEYMRSNIRIFEIFMIQLEEGQHPDIITAPELSSLLFCYIATIQEMIARETDLQGASYTTPRFENHTGRHVTIYWYRNLNPEELMRCCYVDPRGNIYSPEVRDYALGTYLMIKWDDELGEPQYQRSRITSENQIVHIAEHSDLSQWKNGAIKMNYLLHQLIRMGATNEDKYPNLAPIIDLVQDIKIPDMSERDKEVAGVPSVFTNMT